MIAAAWMVSLSGWLLLVLIVLGLVGCLFVALVVIDEVRLQQQRKEIAAHSAARRREQGTR